MKIEIDKSKKTPVYIQLFTAIRDAIYGGRISDGFVLPSERSMADKLSIHRNTVTKAYGELKDAGLVESKPGWGYQVTFSSEEEQFYRKKAVNWQSLMREEYAVFESEFDYLFNKSFDDNIISFGGGIAAREVYPPGEFAGVFEKIFRQSGKNAYFHTPYQGDKNLRREIVSFMQAKGITVKASQIQIFTENNQAMNFLLSLMLEPGKKVITPEAMSADLYRTIRLAGGEVIPVPMDEEGMICENLEAIIEKEEPGFIYVDSSFNNPTGCEMSMERRKKILELSYRYRIPLIEEDEGSELYYDDKTLPSIKSMDTEGNVIYMYSFSLTMIPGLGMSFIIAPDVIIDRMKSMASLQTSSPDWLSQKVLLEYMKSGIFFNRLDDFREICKSKRDLMCSLLDDMKGKYKVSYNMPKGGVYLWVQLPGNINARDLLKSCHKRGITFMPGHLFYSEKSRGKNSLRMNYSYPTEEEIRRGMKIFEEAMRGVSGT